MFAGGGRWSRLAMDKTVQSYSFLEPVIQAHAFGQLFCPEVVWAIHNNKFAEPQRVSTITPAEVAERGLTQEPFALCTYSFNSNGAVPDISPRKATDRNLCQPAVVDPKGAVLDAFWEAMDSRTVNSVRTTAFVAFAAVVGLTAAQWRPAHAGSTMDFYAGRELRLIIPDGAGGGYDAYYRLLARHLSDHIPGHPDLVDENMPGASGLRATNWLYELAPKDGTVVGATYNTLLTEPLLGDTASRYDPTKFEWIGSIDTQYNACMVWYKSPIKTIEDAMTQEVKVSATGLSGNSAKMPLMLNKLIGTRFKVVSGYSTTGARLAVERREVDGICGLSYNTYEVANPEWLQDKKIRFILQDGPSRIKQLLNVPLLIDLVNNPKDRAALKVLDVGQEAGRPVMFPPGVPQDLVRTLRAAFQETMQDPKFLADAHHMHLDPHPITGQQIGRDIRATYAMPKDIVALTAQLWPPATATPSG